MTSPRPIRRALATLAAVAATAALATGTVLAEDHTVNIVGLEFDPAEITIAVGDTITWEVTESIGSPHSVTSGAPGDPDEGEEFDSGPDGLENEGDTFEHTFETAGTFDYYCTVHGAAMSGQVVVEEAEASAGESAAASPEASAGESPAESPGASPGESPAVGEPTPHEGGEPISTERKLTAAGILAAAIVVLFGAAAIWRRVNPA